MFNLPFPTDSLYKFAFMFGLVLIVFALYFRDTHLNKFDHKQDYYILDSIESKFYLDKKFNIVDGKKIPFVLSSNKHSDAIGYTTEITKLITSITNDSTENLALKNKAHYVTLSKEFYYLRICYELLDWKDTSVFIKLPILEKLRFTSSDDRVLYTNTLTNICLKIFDFDYRLNSKLMSMDAEIKQNTLYYRLLLIIGVILFILGILLWYFKIQKLQDELLKMQLAQVKQSVIESNISKVIIIGRKHINPFYISRNKLTK